MAEIVFPASSNPGTRPQESSGRLINAFVEESPVGAPGKGLWRRSPGLTYLAEALGRTHTRGFLDCNGTVLWVLDDRVLSFDSTYTIADRGALLGHEPITLARNNAVTPNNIAVTENGCFNLFTGSAPTAFVDADLPTGPTSVCDFDGYFIWSYNNGTIYASDLNTVAVNALSFTTEQGMAVRRVVRHAGRLYAFGDKWTGVYRNAGTSPFPLAREVTVPRGIVGTHAIAGWETGWANELIWAGDDFNVYKMNGYTPVPVGNDDVSRSIQQSIKDGKRNLIEAFVYMYGKNAFWVLSCHDSWTWEYNNSTGQWNERMSHYMNHWRGMKSVRAFDEWLIGDHETGELYKIADYYYEGTRPLIWHVESGVMSGFPLRTVIPRASFNITTGVGTYPAEAAPVVFISWSLDGGHSWGLPVERHLGGPGRTRWTPSVMCSGLSSGQGVRYRLQVSDPVHVGLSGGVIEPQPRGP